MLGELEALDQMDQIPTQTGMDLVAAAEATAVVMEMEVAMAMGEEVEKALSEESAASEV